ncbi:MAG: D-glycero-beta-D-manno-heptose-7-phosphate kinase [Candidatus Omnitrophica bacterium]|nr:D-glycero-beta-D-manno-heptose-7-phosphate kinase [Candidatus Omnitrophota bacterium]
MHKYAGILNAFTKKHVLVIGDLILDQYIKGSVSRISPEAPVPVVLQEQVFYTPGGAANVANNLSSLGAKVTLVGRVGNDKEGDLLKKTLAERHIRSEGVLTDKRVETILKTRVIAHHQQVVRIDRETVSDDPDNEFYRKTVAPFIKKNFSQFDAIIISDYGKGVVQAALVAEITDMCRKKNIPVIVDPKVEHLKFYGHVASITPNRKEMENALKSLEPDTRRALGIGTTKLTSMNAIVDAGKGLLKYLGIDSLLVTLGEDGMCLFEQGKEPHHIPTRAQEVFDVSGAGDTVISVFTLAIAAGATKRQSADIANHAAGIVVGKMGAASVSPEELVRSLKEDK